MEAGNRHSAYGSGLAGGAFDPVVYIKKPQVICRIVCWVFSIIVFGCIGSGAWYYDGTCKINGDNGCCRFGSAVGVTAFIASIMFLVIDGLFDHMSNVQQRKYAVIIDLTFSGFWSFMWFVCFCYMTDAWRKSDNHNDIDKDKIQTAIAFSFFSIGSWIVQTILAFLRYRQGVSDTFSGGYDGNAANIPPYSGGDMTSDQYQAPPFSHEKSPPPIYQTPTY